MSYKIYYIKWIDTFDVDGWRDKTTLHHLLESDSTIESVGFVVQENDEFVMISNSVAIDNVNAPLSIPKFAIQEMYELYEV